MHNITSPRTDDDATEQKIQAKAVAPRVTLDELEANIASEWYFTAAEGLVSQIMNAGIASSDRLRMDRIEAAIPTLNLLTFCVLVLKNGFTVAGESACASPENFDAEIGREEARKNAKQKLWPLLGFRLRDRLCAEAHAAESPDPEPGSIL